jgi:hypothetical protein
MTSPTTSPSAEEVLAANTATQAHINVVRKLLRVFAVELLTRGEEHDLSKFSPEEVEMYAVYTPRLRGMTYGSDEYRQCLAEMREHGGLQHHYAACRHHPEHFENGINGMNLIDVVEMFLDWLASSKRHDDGDIMKSIDINEKRFNMDPQLATIFRNTASLMEGPKSNA